MFHNTNRTKCNKKFKIQTQQNAKEQNTNCQNTFVTKYKWDKIQIEQIPKYKHDKKQMEQNTNTTTYKCNKIQMQQNTNGKNTNGKNTNGIS